MTEEKKSNLTKDATDDKKNVKVVIRKKFTGVVISSKMDKTILVRVDSVKKDPKYGKRYTASRKYKVDDSKNKFVEGDKVIFVECRPLSKGKRWRVIYS